LHVAKISITVYFWKNMFSQPSRSFGLPGVNVSVSMDNLLMMRLLTVCSAANLSNGPSDPWEHSDCIATVYVVKETQGYAFAHVLPFNIHIRLVPMVL